MICGYRSVKLSQDEVFFVIIVKIIIALIFIFIITCSVGTFFSV